MCGTGFPITVNVRLDAYHITSHHKRSSQRCFEGELSLIRSTHEIRVARVAITINELLLLLSCSWLHTDTQQSTERVSDARCNRSISAAEPIASESIKSDVSGWCLESRKRVVVHYESCTVPPYSTGCSTQYCIGAYEPISLLNMRFTRMQTSHQKVSRIDCVLYCTTVKYYMYLQVL